MMVQKGTKTASGSGLEVISVILWWRTWLHDTRALRTWMRVSMGGMHWCAQWNLRTRNTVGPQWERVKRCCRKLWKLVIHEERTVKELTLEAHKIGLAVYKSSRHQRQLRRKNMLYPGTTEKMSQGWEALHDKRSTCQNTNLFDRVSELRLC